MSRIPLLVTAFILACLAPELPAVPPSPTNPQWVALDAGTMQPELGWAVDISGDRAIVGAPFLSGGSAYVFDVNTGQLIRRLVPNDPSADALFGFSVAIDDNLAVISAGQRSAAYIFDVKTGQQLHKLQPTDNTFVRSVDISEGLAVLGLPFEPSAEPFPREAGAAFVYDARAGDLLYRLNGPTHDVKREFASTVAMEGTTLAISSPTDFPREDVYVYDAPTGRLQWTYGYTTTGQPLDVKDIAIDGDIIAVGVGLSVFDMPEALVLDRQTGELLNRIETRIDNPNDTDKSQLDVSGNRLVVGSWGTFYEEDGYFIGDVHVFDVNSGDYLGSVANPRPAGGDEFGFAVALERDRLIVGAPGEGATYLFHLIPEPSTTALLLVVTMAGLVLRRRTCPV
jgi:outer membrane protein assembly factor BamB